MLVLLPALIALACQSAQTSAEISRDRAIQIAQQHVQFEPTRISAEKRTDEGSEVWQVTFVGQPMSPSRPMGEVMIVSVDRRTGEVVSLGMS